MSLFVLSPEIEHRDEVEVANWGVFYLVTRSKNKNLIS
jgi:hypothetical protein